VVFNGNTLNTSGVYRDTLVNAKGCDSFLVLNLTVNDTTRKDSSRTICKNQPIVFNGQSLNTSGVYRDTFINAKGCDSFLYLILTVIDTTRKDSFRTICKNQSVVFNGNILNTSGTYRDTLVNAKGCDSFIYLHLTVNDTSRKDSFLSICRYQPITFNGQTLSISGIYKDTLINAKGCDSFLYLHLTVNDTSRKDSFQTICKNQFVVFNGNTLNTSGVYRDTMVNAKGCDSFLVLNLTVNDTTRKDSLLTICKNKPIVFNGQSLNISGVYKDTFVNAKGCDSFLYLILTVNDTTRKDSFRTICKNQSVVFNGNTLNTSGTYRDTLVNAKGCDSFVYLYLTVNDTTRKDSFLSICRYQPIIFNGQTLNSAGVYKDTLVNSSGCDSFLYLHLTVNDTSRKDSFRTICKNQFVVFNGNTLNTSGIYRDTMVNAKGCDSFLVLNLTVNDTTRKDSLLTICKNKPIVFNGQSLNISGVYKDTFVNTKGCDSFLYLILTVNDTTKKDSFRTICKNQSVVFNGNTLNTSGMYRDTLINSKGCDSFVYLHLTVNDTTRKDSFLSICRYQPVTFNGQTLNIAGVYKDTLVNSSGCDSFLYLHLTVNDTSRKDSFRTICKNQFVVFNGNTLNTSGVYRDTMVNAKGCDSFLVLNLSVNDTTKKDSLLTICKNKPIVFNGNILNTSGVYRDTFVNAKGCDSFLYLILTVNDTTKKDSFRTICKNQSVVFNGNILNTSGSYRDTLVNAKGCDSFLVLNLTVLDTTTYFFTKNICQGESYTFNQTNHFTGGQFKDTTTNSQGCDSFIYLNLIVNPLPIVNAGADQTRVNCEEDSVRLGSTTNINYTYSWSPNISLSNSNLGQPWSKANKKTTYYLNVIENNTGCQNKDTVEVSIIENDMRAKIDLVDLNCFRDQSGSVFISASKGYPKYQYKLSQTNYTDTGLFTSLNAGTDRYTIRDLKGCLFSDTFALKEPPKLILDSINRKNLSCYQSGDGEIQVYVSGGTRPYSYDWDKSIQVTSKVNKLSSGIFNVTISDGNKCSFDQSIELTEPSQIRIKDTIIQPNPCHGDTKASIEVIANGGTSPYSYLWNINQTSKKIVNLKQDLYKLTITDAQNCKDSFRIEIKDILPLSFDSIKASELNCEDYATIYLNGKGGTPNYMYSIDSGRTFQNKNEFRVSEAKLYNIQVRDVNNCFTKDTIIVRGTERMEIEVHPKDTLVYIGDPVELSFIFKKGNVNKVNSFVWKPSDGLSCSDCYRPIATPYVSMIYYLEVRYNGNCYVRDTARIQHKLDEVFIPNTFSPSSPNPENQTFKIYSNHLLKATLKIFNRWGEKVFESEEANKIGWNGTYKGEPLKYDIYFYWAEVIYLDGRKVIKSGDLTLIR
jgi:gliding motility-associated-like protein